MFDHSLCHCFPIPTHFCFTMRPYTHPLDPITPAEITKAADILRRDFRTQDVKFKIIDLLEAPKSSVLAWINGHVKSVDRRARIYYHLGRSPVLGKAHVNITKGEVEATQDLPDIQGPVDWDEWNKVHEACKVHPKVLEEVAKLKLPPGATFVNDPWAYGTDDPDERRRLMQCYIYIVLNDDPQANHYSIPAPFSPVFDMHTQELLWIDRLPLGEGAETTDVQPWEPVKPVEYSAGILGDNYFRRDLKPLQVAQPEGASFKVRGQNIQWQKWSFQLGWNYREGPVLHNVTYDNRSLFWRVSMSDMTVPYGDPRTPYFRKQAFDLGDSGYGITSNTLTLGCDCLGHIRYFDGYSNNRAGQPVLMKNVVCMHETDQGLGWKHTNYRNGMASMVRDRQLVVQSTATIANYEYVLAFIFDQAANLHIEVKATGILSTMPAAKGVQTPWGTVVADGVIGVNHQHLFSIRIDPALDGQRNSIVYDDCVPVNDPELNPHGVAFNVESTTIKKSGGYDLDIGAGRTYKIINPSKKNPISGKPVGYKVHAVPSQMLLMPKNTFNYKRGVFASKPMWVTKYGEEELWVAGEFTNQSREDTGMAVWAARDDDVENEDVVLWHTFGITHVTRPEGRFIPIHRGNPR